jgi:hypothetical protein
MRSLLRNVKASCVVRILPVASKALAKDGVQRFFNAPMYSILGVSVIVSRIEAMLGVERTEI